MYDEVVLAFEELLRLKEEQHQIEEKLSEATHDDGGDHGTLLERYSEVTDRYKHLGGYEIDARVADVLKGLGFSLADQQRQTEEFSGGWQMRIALAKLLLARPNLLLLDEPTNHLDLPARNWLEEYMAEYPGSVVLVSHDRFFLDATVKRITQVGLRTLTDYHGNYSKYVVEHAARMENLREAHRRQKEEIEKQTAFINKFRYTATKARQVQSRIKMLDKVDLIEIPPERKKIRFKFPDAPKPGRVVVELKDVRRTYGDNVVLDKVDLLIERGDRVALVGPNGAGKSTLMRIFAGVDHPDAGARVLGHNVVIDYFAQDQASVLTTTRTVYEEMTVASPTTMVPMIRNILGGFLFSGDDVYKKAGVLSGGERNRLALAKMLLNASNLLVLDEPTNHLDLDSKEVLLEALADYGGTLVFVSHDRYFVDNLATKVVEIGNGQALLYPGGYEDFLYWKKQRELGLAAPLPTATRPHVVPPEAHDRSRGQGSRRRAGGEARPRGAEGGRPEALGFEDRARALLRSPGAAATAATVADPRAREKDARKTKARLAELERQIGEKEQRVKDVEGLMAGPGFYDDRARADEAVTSRQKLLDEVNALMAEWESLQAAVEVKS